MRRRVLLGSLVGLGVVGCGRPGEAALPPGAPPRPVAPEATPEAIARKLRSMEVLRREGISSLDSLPVIESSTEVRLRSPAEVVKRYCALMLVAYTGELGDPERSRRMRQLIGANAALSPAEQAFMDKPAPSMEERVPFSWASEAAVPLAWALGKLERMPRPDRTINAAEIETLGHLVFDDGGRALAAAPRLRPVGEILDAADLIYRYHWPLVEARLGHVMQTGGLNEEVVMERHKGLNWLISYGDADWDDVSTDT